jgi:hypothetical protein
MKLLGLKFHFLITLSLAFVFGCKPDNFRPVVQTLIISDIDTDTIASDTLFNITFPIQAEYTLTDKKGVTDYRFEFNRTNDTLPDLHFIDLGSAGNLTEFTGFTTVNFNQSILDTLPPNPGYYFITVDCFDETGNQALQKKSILEIVIN